MPHTSAQFLRAFREGDAGDGPLVFTASTAGVKRDGLDLRASGWRIDSFQRNPVILWAHDRRALPIGRGSASVENDRLRIAVEFDQDDEFARQIEGKFRRGFLNGVSVGWRFVDAEGGDLEWWRMTKEELRDEAFYELTELSAVPVPSDPDALAERGLTEADVTRIVRALTAPAAGDVVEEEAERGSITDEGSFVSADDAENLRVALTLDCLGE